MNGLKIKILSAAVAILGVLFPALASAASQGFTVVGSQPQMGMLMSLTPNSQVVEPATDKTTSALVGVTAPNSSNFTEQPGQVNVQTDGVANALVSTLGGDIRVGDRITASSIQGIGQKLAGSGWIVGIAQASLDKSTSTAVQTTVTDSAGKQQTVYVASIPLVIKATYYSANTSTATDNSQVPQSLQKLANALAHKHVSVAALIFSFAIFLIGVIATVIIVTSSIRNTFTGIARQPLARTPIIRAEMRSLAFGVGILIFSLLAGFLILRIL